MVNVRIKREKSSKVSPVVGVGWLTHSLKHRTMGRKDCIQGQQLLETLPENATTPLLPLEDKCSDRSHDYATCLLTMLKLSIIFLTYCHNVSLTTMQINLQGIARILSTLLQTY